MVSSGMVALGYKTILLDDCWAATTRDAKGNLQPDPTRFPSGIPSLVQYVEERGLLLGLYTCAGNTTCKYGRPGSEGHYAQDAAWFAAQGVKWVKADNCNVHTGTQPHVYYSQFGAALNSTGTAMVFHTCEWGEDSVWEWGPSVAQVYRINTDHLPFWRWDTGNGGQGVADIIEVMANPAISGSTRPYAYADPDFLMTGLAPLTNTESETEFALWALFSGPMLIATDIRNMSAWKAGVVGNKDILAVNQDPAVLPCKRVRNDTDGGQVWMKPLGNGDIAAVAYNSGDGPTALNISVTWAELGWAPSTTARVYDLWAHAPLPGSPGGNGLFTGGAEAVGVLPHGNAMWRLTRQ